MEVKDIILLESDGTKSIVSSCLSESVLNFRTKACQKLGCADTSLRLIFCGREVKDIRGRAPLKLSDFKIGARDSWTIHCALKPTLEWKMKKAADLSGSAAAVPAAPISTAFTATASTPASRKARSSGNSNTNRSSSNSMSSESRNSGSGSSSGGVVDLTEDADDDVIEVVTSSSSTSDVGATAAASATASGASSVGGRRRKRNIDAIETAAEGATTV